MSNVPMTRPDEVIATHDSADMPFTTFVELSDGRVLGAGREHFATSEDGGMTWSEPFQRRDANGDVVGGNSLVKLDGDAIGILAGQEDSHGSMEFPSTETYRWEMVSERKLVFWRSEDGGETWAAPARVTPPHVGAAPLHDTMIRTSSGRLVLPVYITLGQAGNTIPVTEALGPGGVVGKLLNGHWISTSAHYFDTCVDCSYTVHSDDGGRTWQRNKNGNIWVHLDWNATVSYTNEPTITEVSPGKLLMLLRTGIGRLYQSWSYDDGYTWGRSQPTSLAASTAPAQIRTLPNGHLLAVWNQMSEEEVKEGYLRTRLSTAISRNGGSVWEFFQNLESLHEETRVEPGPVRRGGPAEYSFGPGKPAPERESQHVTPATEHATWTYPAVLVMKDQVLISYGTHLYEEHPTRAELVSSSFHRLKVLPMSWFYGGKEPADNPALPRV